MIDLDRIRRELAFAATLARGAYFDCEVLLGYRCNLVCRFCAFPERVEPPGAPLAAADYARIARELAQEGALIVSLEGGEPLLRPDLEAIVAGFASHHLPLVATNGMLITPERARALFAAGLWQAAVSIDYLSAGRHDDHRGRRSSHARAVLALTALRDAAPRASAVHAFTVLMDDNLEELPELLALTARIGVRHQVSVISTTGDARRAGERTSPPCGTGARLSELAARFPHLTAFPSYHVEIDRWLAGAPVAPCRAGLQGFTIDPAGNVSPCNDQLGMSAGNLAREPWADVRERLQAMREPRGCNRCYTLCRGLAHALGGGLFSVDWGALVRAS